MKLWIWLVKFFDKQADRTIDSSGIDRFVMVQIFNRDTDKSSFFIC